jgi:hypothetical protein
VDLSAEEVTVEDTASSNAVGCRSIRKKGTSNDRQRDKISDLSNGVRDNIKKKKEEKKERLIMVCGWGSPKGTKDTHPHIIG